MAMRSHLYTSWLALWLTPNRPLLHAPHARAADSHPAEPYDPHHARRPDELQTGSDAWPKPQAVFRPTGRARRLGCTASHQPRAARAIRGCGSTATPAAAPARSRPPSPAAQPMAVWRAGRLA